MGLSAITRIKRIAERLIATHGLKLIGDHRQPEQQIRKSEHPAIPDIQTSEHRDTRVYREARLREYNLGLLKHRAARQVTT